MSLFIHNYLAYQTDVLNIPSAAIGFIGCAFVLGLWSFFSDKGTRR
jgi:hypothetical protein